MKHTNCTPRSARESCRTASVLTALLCVLLLTVVGGCAGARSTDSESLAFAERSMEIGPGPILPSDALMESFFIEQDVTVRWPEGERTFRAVLQKEGDSLELIGIGPMSRPAFRIRLEGTTVSVEYFSDRELPFAAEFLIADVQKAFFPWLGELPASVPRNEGDVEGLHVVESRTREDTVRRTFSRITQPDLGEVVVTVTSASNSLPSHIELANGWFGYELEIRTVRAQLLSSDGQELDR